MIYAIEKLYDDRCNLMGYNFFETTTEQFFKTNIEETITLLQCNTNVVNLHLVNGNIAENKWPNQIGRSTGYTFEGPHYIFLGTDYLTSTLRLVRVPNNLFTASYNDVIDLALKCDIANAEYKNGRFKAVDTESYAEDVEFENLIEKKCEAFYNKCALLGIDNSFYYLIKNKDVILHSYRGKNKNVIIPGFVTSIANSAFKYKNLDSVQFNNGLKVIGEIAFEGTGLKQVTIPASVTIVAGNSFISTKGKKCKIILENSNTLIARNYI